VKGKKTPKETHNENTEEEPEVKNEDKPKKGNKSEKTSKNDKGTKNGKSKHKESNREKTKEHEPLVEENNGEDIPENQEPHDENNNGEKNLGEDAPPVPPKRNNRKSFYDYSDYGALQEQLSLSEEETDFSESKE